MGIILMHMSIRNPDNLKHQFKAIDLLSMAFLLLEFTPKNTVIA